MKCHKSSMFHSKTLCLTEVLPALEFHYQLFLPLLFSLKSLLCVSEREQISFCFVWMFLHSDIFLLKRKQNKTKYCSPDKRISWLLKSDFCSRVIQPDLSVSVKHCKTFSFLKCNWYFAPIATFSHSPILHCTCVWKLYRGHLFFSSSLFWASNCRFQAGTADSFLSFGNPVKTTIFKTLAVNIKVI